MRRRYHDGSWTIVRDRRVRQTAEMMPGIRAKEPQAPRTNVVYCVVCWHAYPLRSHDPHTCARKRGLDGADLYVREHAFAREAANA